MLSFIGHRLDRLILEVAQTPAYRQEMEGWIMKPFSTQADSIEERSGWKLILLPLTLVLGVLAPIVDWVCGTFIVLGSIASIAIEISAAGPEFPFLTMMAVWLGLLVFLVAYHALLEFLTS